MAQNTATELPDVAETEMGDPVSTAYFENGAKLRYKRAHDGIVEQVFAPSDSDSVMEEAFITDRPETTANMLSESLEFYRDFETVEQLKPDWTNLAEWICHE